MITKEQSKEAILKLVERFENQIESYKHKDYNETLTRRDFIDPFFKALGWDVDNSQDYAEAYREVIHEDKVKVGKATKAPDYSFRLPGGKRLFFVEAKKPSVAVKDDILPAYQIRRYGWSAKLPISIVTDFEEFAVYDCTKKPNPNDKASVARIKYLTFRDYIKEFDFLWDAFSKEQVLKGSFDKYIKSDNKKGTTTVDKEFLISLDNWRILFAENLVKNNKTLDEDEINFVVQQTIDRIIFLRIAEDRSIETYGYLKNALQKGVYYDNLFAIFKEADQKYNSGLFDTKKDKISENIKIDNSVIKTIINQLYFPESPYEFSVLSVEILGSAYEQFLGKTITITDKHKIVIEQKPEVRKAGGVYYTPQYIVDYIVQNTVGKLVEGKTPKEVSEITICDPACGSGSFLIGAYQYLLDWHKNYYSENPNNSKKVKENPLTPDGNLTTNEKKRILVNNIYGVDIDANAVEVTKLSLLLKCLEGETEASINQQTKLFTGERILPTLDKNILCGNSLIDFDFYDNNIDFGEERKIKPFSWQKSFPNVFSKGGFDTVIGNPPYVTLQLGKKQKSQENIIINYYENIYKNSFEYKANLFALFIERSQKLIRKSGLLSFIVPNTLYNTISFKSIRKYLIDKGQINTLLDLRYKVFDGAEIGGCAIFIFQNDKSNSNIKLKIIENISNFQNSEYLSLLIDEILSDRDYNYIQTEIKNKIITKIYNLKNIKELNLVSKIYQGIITGDNKKFISETPKDINWKPILKGRDINKYSLTFNNNYVYYVPKELWSNTDSKMFNVKAKIISRQTSDKLIATIDTSQYFTLDSTHVIHIINPDIFIEYFLGLYNSKLLNFIYQNRVNEGGRVFAQVKTINLKPLPIKIIDFSNKQEKEAHDQIVKLVDTLLQLNKEIQDVSLESKKEMIKNKIQYCEDKIDQLVYEIYDLTEEEIKIVENI